MKQPFWVCGAVLAAATGSSLLTLYYSARHPVRMLTRCCEVTEPAPTTPARPAAPAELPASVVNSDTLVKDDCKPEVIDLSLLPAAYKLEEPPLAEGAAPELPLALVPVLSSPIFARVPAIMPAAADGEPATIPMPMPPARTDPLPLNFDGKPLPPAVGTPNPQVDPTYFLQYPGVIPYMPISHDGGRVEFRYDENPTEVSPKEWDRIPLPDCLSVIGC
jgi:hypothetical protein